MFPIVDVSKWDRLHTEQMGTKPKFWCLDSGGAKYLFKESRAHSGEHWSEKLAAEFAELLSLPHAEIQLAVCDGRNGTISRRFHASTEPSSLIHGNELLFEHDSEYPKEAPNFRLAQHTLDRIFLALEQEDADLPSTFRGPSAVTSASELFVGYLLLDALIGNTDRHHANWAVMRCLNPPRVELAPTFDHASSLGRELSDRRRVEKLKAEKQRLDSRRPARRDQTVVGYLEKDAGRSRIYASERDAKPLHPTQVFQHAFYRFASAGEVWLKQLALVSMSAFETTVDLIPPGVMTDPAREFALAMLYLNRMALISRTFRYA